MKKTKNQLLLLLFCLAVYNVPLYAQVKKTITGTVRSAKGEPLPNVTIIEKGTTNNTITNEEGGFSINANSNGTLVFSSVGFISQSVPIGNKNSLTITLQETKKELEEVVVTSLGIKRPSRSLGYAATVIGSSQITETAPTNFATSLYGKAPGVRIAATPGGPTSGVNIQVRGVNSIMYKTTPLIVMDGIPIRDGEVNNNSYWSDQRIRGNGLIDINPEDIESITILKGASAAALYGSEATNGVLVITTKSGKGKKGFSVDASLNYFQDKVAYLPRFQNVRGAGIGPQVGWYTTDANGFDPNTYTINGQNYRATVQGSLNFGPVFDGKPIACWDGVVRPYSAQKNGYASMFQVARNSTVNVAVSNTTDISNTRLSVTHQESQGISLTSKNNKNTVSLNNNFKLGSKYSIDVVLNYINQHIHNRPYMIDRLVNNFTGMLPIFDNGDWYKNKYQTSLGYRFVTGNGTRSLTPNENIYIPNYRTDILDYMWRVYNNRSDEYSNRLIGSITNNWQILKDLKFRLRLSTDATTTSTYNDNYSTVPLAYGFSGSYSAQLMNYYILYGDALLTYTKKLNKDLELNIMGGYTADKEISLTNNTGTNGGLSIENKFDLKSGVGTPWTSSVQTNLVKDALIGTVNFNYKNYLYAEGTVRRDRTSLLFPGKNSFVYPSLNAGFIISDAMKLPEILNYAKLRASWGIVGNYPPQYAANVAYNIGNLGPQGTGYGSVLTSGTMSSFGNNDIRPEQKHEYEFGVELRLLNNKLNVDMSYYNAKIVDQILSLTLPQSSGAASVLTNIGILINKGFELGINWFAYQSRNFSWNTGINFSTNQNKVVQLTTGASELLHQDFDGNAAQLKSVVGQPMGDLYAHPILTDSKGNKVVGSDGLYMLDANKMQNFGNTMPKAVGGYFNSFKYKNFSLDMFADFRFGGYVMPTGINWMTSRGNTVESLNYMDAAHGGLSYYQLTPGGVGVQTTASSGPGGQTVYHDGMLMDGVTITGEKNTNIVSQAYYYNNVYNWGGPQYSEAEYFLFIKKNSYIKMRELSLGYTLPSKIASLVKAKKLQASVFGRNLFYFYRTIKDIDAEQLTAGSNWKQSVSNAGTNPSTRTFGFMIRASF